ncbi:hypothetical protein BX600DRAFT_96755 [Xylariales sp. PMI_506]|nr:hypothetical protein BX600DRAFT_96755 [Xylariales sp. PMI_506]
MKERKKDKANSKCYFTLRKEEAQTDPNNPTKELDMVKVINTATGEVVNSLPFPNFYRFLRSRFRALMAEGINVEFSKRLSSLTYAEDGSSVTAHFIDGTSVRGRLVIGADGSNSAVRHLLLGPELAKLKRLSIATTFINASYTREQALSLRSHHPLMNVIVHPDNMIGMLATLDAPREDEPEGWRFTFYMSRLISVEQQDAESAVMGVPERLAEAKALGATLAEPMRSAYAWLPDDLKTVYWTGSTNWDPSLEEHRWNNHQGLVTLAGDAAHPMTFHRGQGLNHALDDAGHIVKLLSGASNRPQSEIIQTYEDEMRSRAGDEVRLSEMNSYMVHDWEKLSQSPLMNRVLAKGGENK